VATLPATSQAGDWGIFARRAVFATLIAAIISFGAGGDPVESSFVGRAAIFAIIGISLNILMGYAGQISLGHNAFVGVGAFAAAFLTANQGVPMYLSVPLAAAIGAVTSIILGAVALRIRGLYLALITLAYGLLAERSIFQIQELTGGGAGIQVFRPEPFTSDNFFTLVCMAILGLVLFLDWRMMESKFGRALLAMKSDEQVAASMGINLVFYKLAAFILAGAIAGLAGGLLAFNQELVVSQDFTFNIALTYVIMIVIGGLGRRTGVVIGSVVIAYLVRLLEAVGRGIEDADLPGFLNFLEAPIHWLGENVPQLQIAIGAFLLIGTITLFPGGLYQQLEPVITWLKGHPFPRHSHGKDAHEGAAAVEEG
jgi:branched-chain amino acid transport system permease protein